MCAYVSGDRPGSQAEAGAPDNVARCRHELCLRALASSRRLALVVKLCDGEMSVNELTQWMGLTQPKISHHLSVLRDAGLVKVRHEGQLRLYQTDLLYLHACCHRLFRLLRVRPCRRQRMQAGEAADHEVH